MRPFGRHRSKPAAFCQAALRYVASTRVCTTSGISGVPVGTQTDRPAIVTTGAPPAITRTAPTTQFAVAQGGLPEPVSAQPAIANGEASVTAGWPESSTRGNGASGVA